MLLSYLLAYLYNNNNNDDDYYYYCYSSQVKSSQKSSQTSIYIARAKPLMRCMYARTLLILNIFTFKIVIPQILSVKSHTVGSNWMSSRTLYRTVCSISRAYRFFSVLVLSCVPTDPHLPHTLRYTVVHYYYAPAPRSEGIRRWCASDVCLSVAYIGHKSKTERPRKTTIGTEVAHITRDSDTTFKVKRSKVNLQGAGHWRPPVQLVISAAPC